MNDDNKLSMESRRWENRRRMAWRAFYLASLLTITLVVELIYVINTMPPDKLAAIAQFWPLATAMLGGLWGVVMAYIGSAAYSDVRLWK